MLHQKKKVFGILFFALLVSATFLIKNIVWATVDSVGNSITGTNINIANVASYDVTMQFSGTLDSGDIVVVELIDTSLTTLTDTYISTGDNETTIIINFDASTLSEWTITLSGSIFDSWLNIITWEITTTILLDTILPTFDGVTSWTQYSGDVAITFDDTNLSWATLNGTAYTSWDVISAEWSYEFIVTDTAGNSTGATFVIDKSEPTFDGVISWTYYSGDVTITFSDTATVNWAPISSGDSISTDGIYILIVIDEASNQTGATFTIDKTPPAISNITSGSYFSGNITPAIVEINFSWATLDGAEYIPATEITGEATYELIITDLANNITAVTFVIDTTLPTAYVEYAPTSGSRTSGNVVAIITGFSESIVNQNTWVNIFVNNGSFTFTFEDLAGNPWSSTAMVDWIDNVAPTVSTGYISVGNTGNNWATQYYKDTITIRADVSDTGWSSLNTGSCEYTIDGSSRIAADYTTGYCYKSWLSPADDITIAFRMQDTVGNITTGNIETYLYDDAIPTATDDANSTTGRIDVTVIITAVDTGVGISGTLYCIDTAGSCTPNISWASISVTGATNAITHKYVRYYSIDKLNNTGTIQTSAQINIDKETPLLTGTTTFSTSNGNTWYAKTSDTITVLFSSHEELSTLPILTISWAIYTGTVTNIWWNNYSGTYDMRSTDTQGIIGFNILMTDLVGNTGTIHTTSAIIFDRTVPAGISITSPSSTSYRQNGNTYMITRNGWSEINFGSTWIKIEYSNNEFWEGAYTSIIATGMSNDWSLLRTVDSVDTSSAQMRIIATDLAGNRATFTGSQFIIDSTLPTSPSFVYPEGWYFLKWWSGYLVVRSWWWDDNLSGKILERSTWWSFTTIATLGNGAFSYLWTPSASINSSTIRLGIKYQDKWWLASPYVQTDDFIVDSTKPTVTFTDTNTNRRNYNATGTTTSWDALAGIRSTGVLYRTDVQFDQYCNGWSTTVPVLTAEWTGYIYACVQDKAGNVKTGVQMYRIDKTAPLVSTGTSKKVNTATAMTITVTGDFAGISWYTRSKLSGPWAITFTTAGSQNPLVSADTEGEYSLQVLVQDNASNIATGIISFTRDITAPVLTWSTASVSNSTATFSFTGDEAGTISYSWACGNGSLTTAISWRNTTTFSLANATYSTCKVQVTDVAGNGSSRLNISTFTVNYSAPSGGGGWGWWGGGWLPTCLDNQLVCNSGKYAKKSGVVCQWGKLNTTCGIDVCIDGDYSGSPTDGLCKDPTKVEASTGIIVTNTSTGRRVTVPSPFNKELTDAYAYAFWVKITTISSIEKANMQWVLIRSHLAKMMSEYAIKVLWQTPDTSRSCVFSDMQNQSEELKMYAVQACQLWLMGLKTDGTPATKFTPTGEVTRAIFGTTLSRALRGETYNWWTNRYEKHLKALQNGAIMTKIDKPFNSELRGYVMLMMMRADQDITKSSYTKFTSARGTKIFVANTWSTTSTTGSQFTTAELSFIQNINKNYQFNEGYTAGDADIGIKYLQYFLKSQKIYTGTINGINGTTTISALFQYQLDNNIIKDKNDTWAGYLGPTTRTIINPLLKTLLNP